MVWRQVVVIGAGPYGLSVASHLRARGIEVRTFGRTMEFWKRQMPVGMRLRSTLKASDIGAGQTLRLADYALSKGAVLPDPLPVETFIDYGEWVQRQTVPDPDERTVRDLTNEPNGGFRLTLEDGEHVLAEKVVVAAGLSPFAYFPEEFRGLPENLVSHSSQHHDFEAFAGRRVAVVGGGQSALESAALLLESGAHVEVINRALTTRWLSDPNAQRLLSALRTLVDPGTGVGGPASAQIFARPQLFRMLPLSVGRRMHDRALRPRPSHWLRPRLAGVTVMMGRSIVRTAPRGSGLRLTLNDGSQRDVDHILLGTGYRVDIARYGFLGPEMLRRVAGRAGYPLLKVNFESSIPGLFFAGAPSSLSFGPLERFVCGTDYCGSTIAQSVASHQFGLSSGSASVSAVA